MRESKAELTDRLRREGRFDAFKKRREELKAEGVPAKQAWYQAATEFPPPIAVPVAQPSDAATTEPLEALKGKCPVPLVQAAFWVFEHMDTPWTQPVDAPSPGAWSLLSWARQSSTTRTEFYRTFGPKLEKAPLPDLEPVSPEVQQGLETTRRMLKEWRNF